MDCIKNVVKKVDLFGSPVNLLHKGNYTKNSLVGGIGTIAIFLGCIIIFNSNIRGFFNFQFVSFSTAVQFDQKQKTNFNSSNSLFAVGVNGINLLDINSEITLTVLPITRFANGSRATLPAIGLRKCERDEWASLGSSYAEYFDSNLIQSFACFQSYSFDVAGQFGSSQFSYLRITLSPSGTDQRRVERVMAQAGGYLQLNLIYQNTNMNYIDTFKPFRHFPDRSYYRFVPYYQQISIDKYIQQVHFKTDISVFPFQNVIQHNNITFVQADSTVYLPYSPAQTQFLKCFIRIQNSRSTIMRNVQSLEDFLSFLGGMFSILQVLGNLVFTHYSQHRLHIKIFNQLGKQNVQNRNPIALQTSFIDFLLGLLLCDSVKHHFQLNRLILLDEAMESAENDLDLIEVLKRVRRLERLGKVERPKHLGRSKTSPVSGKVFPVDRENIEVDEEMQFQNLHRNHIRWEEI